MSVGVGDLREATNDLTGPKMQAGVISSATKLPVKNFSGGVKVVRPLAWRSALAFWLVAPAGGLILIKSRSPRNIRNRCIPSLPPWRGCERLKNVSLSSAVLYVT